MNDYPAPGWMFNYFLIPINDFLTAIEYKSIMETSKGTAYRQLYEFLNYNLVERKRVQGPGGRECWGYRRILHHITYDQGILNQIDRSTNEVKAG